MQMCLVLCKTLDIFAVFYGQENGQMGKSWTTNNFLVVSIVDDNSLKGTKAHAYLQFNR